MLNNAIYDLRRQPEQAPHAAATCAAHGARPGTTIE